jgi:uncharacterized protein (DUF1778 family)
MGVHCTYVVSLMYVRGDCMPATAPKKRTERINVRVSDREAKLIRMGAAHRGVNITNFILESACVRAEQELADVRHFTVSSEEWQKFSQALDRPATTKPRLNRLLNEPSVLERR